MNVLYYVNSCCWMCTMIKCGTVLNFSTQTMNLSIEKKIIPPLFSLCYSQILIWCNINIVLTFLEVIWHCIKDLVQQIMLNIASCMHYKSSPVGISNRTMNYKKHQGGMVVFRWCTCVFFNCFFFLAKHKIRTELNLCHQIKIVKNQNYFLEKSWMGR